MDHPRSGRHGGGTGVLFRNNLTVNRVSAAELRSFEYSEWNIKAGTRRIRLVVVYRIPYSDIHPVSTTIFFDEFAKFLESAVLCTDQLLITGDFNIHVDVTDDVDAVKLQELLESTGLQQHVNVPTHIRGHTLDLIITRHSENIVTSPPRTDYIFSDHMPVHCNLLVNKPRFKKTHISYRKVKSINVDALCNDLSNSDLCKNMLSMELNDLVDCYNHTLSSSLDRHAPVNHKTVVKRPTVPWFNEEVKLAKRARRRAERKWRRTKLYGDFLVYKSKKNQATFVMKRARNEYYTTFIQENSSDHRKLFKSAKFLFNQETDLHFPEYSDNTVLANDIGDFFAKKIECIRQDLDSAATYDNPTSEPQIMPNVQLDSFKTLTEDDVNQIISNSSKKSCSLDPMPTHLVVHCLDVLLPVITRMINLSLQSGCFPENWKLAKVHPGLKKSKAEVIFDNLRPISNLSFVSKLTERAVFNQTHDHLTAHKLYPKAQSSYRQYHSTETALLRVKNDILMNMNKQHVTLLVLLDLSAAFDTVDHTILLNRLRSSFGITGRVLTWFKSYLENRSQCISINGGESRSFEMKYGVPQGSCLGPVLFVIYASKLFTILESHLPDVHAFADDSQLYISFKPVSMIEQSAAIKAMQDCITDIKKWMLADKLKLNDDKTEFIIIGTRQQLAKVSVDSLCIGDEIIKPSSVVRNLGSWFDSQLKMDLHINKCCKAAFFHLFNIRRIRKFLSFDTTQILINAFVTSRLDYCNSLLYGLPANQIYKLQRVQNSAARLICNINRFDHITPALYKLHWLPVRYRINFKILLITYKAINGLAPEYISELIKFKVASRYNLRSSTELLLEKPGTKTLTTLGDRSFQVAAPTLWNRLPAEIRNACNVASFKKMLKPIFL